MSKKHINYSTLVSEALKKNLKFEYPVDFKRIAGLFNAMAFVAIGEKILKAFFVIFIMKICYSIFDMNTLIVDKQILIFHLLIFTSLIYAAGYHFIHDMELSQKLDEFQTTELLTRMHFACNQLGIYFKWWLMVYFLFGK